MGIAATSCLIIAGTANVSNGVDSRTAAFGRRAAIADVSYAAASRYDPPRLFPIVVPGLGGRWMSEA